MITKKNATYFIFFVEHEKERSRVNTDTVHYQHTFTRRSLSILSPNILSLVLHKLIYTKVLIGWWLVYDLSLWEIYKETGSLVIKRTLPPVSSWNILRVMSISIVFLASWTLVFNLSNGFSDQPSPLIFLFFLFWKLFAKYT